MQREQCLGCSRCPLSVCCWNSFHPSIPKVRLVLYIQCLWTKLVSRNTGAWIHACSWGWAGICHHDVSYQILCQSSRLSMWGVVHFSVSSRFICSHPIGCPWLPAHVAWHVPSLKRVQLIGHLSSWPSCKTWSSMYLLQQGLESRKRRRSFWLGPRLGEGSAPEFIEEVVMSRVGG